LDGWHEVGYGAVCAAFDLFVGQQREEAFNLINFTQYF
jgi:hypothetical protein